MRALLVVGCLVAHASAHGTAGLRGDRLRLEARALELELKLRLSDEDAEAAREQFDRDRDGALDSAERAALAAYLEVRLGRWHRLRLDGHELAAGAPDGAELVADAHAVGLTLRWRAPLGPGAHRLLLYDRAADARGVLVGVPVVVEPEGGVALLAPLPRPAEAGLDHPLAVWFQVP